MCPLEIFQLRAYTFNRSGSAALIAATLGLWTGSALEGQAQEFSTGMVIFIALVEALRDNSATIAPGRGPCDRRFDPDPLRKLQRQELNCRLRPACSMLRFVS